MFYLFITQVLFGTKVWKALRVLLFGRTWANNRKDSSIRQWIPKKISKTLFSPGAKDSLRIDVDEQSNSPEDEKLKKSG